MESDEAAGRGAAVLARAKINLYLHVTGRGTDGYHTLDSLHVRTCLADRLWFAPAPETRLDMSGPFARSLEDGSGAMNLVTRAVMAIREASSSRRHLSVHLEKNIPVAAGLGGGSADAAATLGAASAMLGCTAGIAGIAASLGADVPSCLHDDAVITSGRGDIIRPAPPLPRCAVVLVNPGTQLSTRKVFHAHGKPFSRPRPLDRTVEDYDGLVRELALRHNDLEPAACRLEPAIRDVLAMLRRQQHVGIARMTGSGATCFGLVESIGRAREAAAAIGLSRPDWWVEATGIVTGRPA